MPDGIEIRFGDEAMMSAQAVFSDASKVLDSILFGGVTVEAAAGDIRITGEMAAMERLLQAFPLPPAAPDTGS